MDQEYEEIIHEEYPTNLIDKDWSQRKCYFLKGSQEFMKNVHEMELREDDVWLVTVAKCGTTWMQELIWLVMHDFDFGTAKEVDLELRTPFWESDFIIYRDSKRAFKTLNDSASPRLIKSHSPLPLLPKQFWIQKPKVVYVCRNLKDAVVSTYYFCRSFGKCMNKSLDEFVRTYVGYIGQKLLPFDHFQEFYLLRNEPWVYYTSFEKMKSNLSQVIEDVCKFLDKSITMEQMEQMLKHLSFDEMKNNPKVQHSLEVEQARKSFKLPFEDNQFYRKGSVNIHKEVLSEESIRLLDKWIEQQEIKLAYNIFNIFPDFSQ